MLTHHGLALSEESLFSADLEPQTGHRGGEEVFLVVKQFLTLSESDSGKKRKYLW